MVVDAGADVLWAERSAGAHNTVPHTPANAQTTAARTPQPAPAQDRLVVLGTGNAAACRWYNTCFVLDDGAEPLLVDAGGGNGICRQLAAAHIPLARLKHAFLSHAHTDHLFGMIWILRFVASALHSGQRTEPFSLYCHSGLAATVRTVASLTLGPLVDKCGEALHIIPVEDGECRCIGARDITFFDVGARKMRQFGFSTSLSDGKKLTFLGDEPFRPCALPYAAGSAWLLHEAFCLDSEKDIFHPKEKAHSTVLEACHAASALGVENLVLWHTEDTRPAERKARYLAEGAPAFAGNLFVPDDLEVIPLTAPALSRAE